VESDVVAVEYEDALSQKKYILIGEVKIINITKTGTNCQ